MQLRQKQSAAGASPTRAIPVIRTLGDKPSGLQRQRSGLAVRAQAAGGDPQVICFGEALFDLLADQKGLKRAEVKSWTPYPGGAPCNVATALQRLGVPTAFVSALGHDDRGKDIMALLKERGVDTSGVQRNERPTRDIYAERTLDGDRVFAGFGRPTEEYSDVAIEADQLPLDKIKVAQLLPKAEGVLVTAGDRGAAYCFHAANKGEHTGFVPVFQVDVVDTTGAGDAFTAGFAYKLLEAGGIDRLGSDPEVLKKAVVFAAATGALTCTRPGAIAAQPTLEEVQALYEKSKAFDHLWNQTRAD